MEFKKGVWYDADHFNPPITPEGKSEVALILVAGFGFRCIWSCYKENGFDSWVHVGPTGDPVGSTMKVLAWMIPTIPNDSDIVRPEPPLTINQVLDKVADEIMTAAARSRNDYVLVDTVYKALSRYKERHA